ncbi:hypothetical protein L1987_66616 [Smallanthus sonchifolius]|uniref:Uncharacterized protein n=1 Tax=Smallanthus sonchifolius TaxID=185202 RepID=A0ACB9BXY0_9ASTR|nr:hypothetical protein L1987_66616 [Smallanthus sonchifolius]
MIWNRIEKSSQAFSAHTLLFCFTIFLVLKLDHLVSYSWWIIFSPLLLFHALVARGRLSLPGLSVSHGRYVEPFYVPALIAFELLLCAFLESSFVKKIVSLRIVFLPLLAFELTVLVDNFRKCKDLLAEVDVIWEPLCHFLFAVSMGFFCVGTMFTIRELSGDISSLGWWDVFIYFGIAECFVFLVCTNCSNSVIHRNSEISVVSSSSTAIRYRNWNSGIVGSTEDISENRMCGLQDIGGHVMKILIIVFQILLCMRLEGKPAAARFIPLPVVFSPIFLVQGLGVLFAASSLIKKIVILLRAEAGTGTYFTNAARTRDPFDFLRRGSSQEEQARRHNNGSSRYNTFPGHPPEKVKRLPKKDLTKEVRKPRAALNEQTEITESSQQNFERLPNGKTTCRICYEGEINTLLLPCRHLILCSICSEKCQECPICRAIIKKRLPVYGV